PSCVSSLVPFSPCCFLIAGSLFLLLSMHHRYLRSFPTRRSSDLISLPDHSLDLDDLVVRGGDRGVEFFCRLSSCVYLHTHLTSIDRKSTRLNSSHVSISYSVFCLKKKITITFYILSDVDA